MTIAARFNIPRRDFTLDIDLQIPARGVTAVFGPSGCGKTTLLRAIAGLEQSQPGYLRIGQQIWQDDTQFLPAHKRPVGYVFQEPSLFSHLSVQGNLDYGLKRVNTNERKVSLGKAIELLDIGQLLHRSIDQLSGGEQQRVAIARALAVSPEILLMDEPLSALDVSRKQEIMPYLESLHDELEIPVLYVSHSPDEVARLADQLVLLDNGKIKASGSITEMLTRLDLPLAHGDDASALIQAEVSGHDEEFKLTYLDFAGGRFTVTRQQFPDRHAVRLRVAARDVSLTLEHQSGTSILNIFPATVKAIMPENPSQAMVQLTAGDTPLLARVTHKSVNVLGLEPGKQVYAQVKSVALLS